jgi:hypothetical protein
MTTMMKPLLGLCAATVVGAMLATAASAQPAREALGATPWETLDKEPPPKLIVDPPLEEPLSRGAFVAQYRTENFRIVAEVGSAAVAVSPRIGHLHITVDNLPWHWAEANDHNTIIVVGLPPGPHEVHVELADPTHKELGGQTVRFVVPASASHAH